METSALAGNGIFTTTIRFIQDGGVFMYPILLVLAVGLGIIIERVIYLQTVKTKNRNTWNQIYPLLSKGKFQNASKILENSDTGLSRVLGHGLDRARTSTRHEDIELAMDEGLMEVLPRLETRTGYVGTLANIATLLGLLGTILGLIAAFTAVASADPAQKADLLSASISVAMNTTAFGLMTAIPLLLAHAFINSMTNKIVDSMEMASVKFLNIFRTRANMSESAANQNS